MRYLTAPQAAKKLKVTRQEVARLIRIGKLEATRFGNYWMIREQDVRNLAPRKRGRPKR